MVARYLISRILARRPTLCTGHGLASPSVRTSLSRCIVSEAAVPNALESNAKARLELAIAYRALEQYNLHEGVCNHLSLMAPAASGQGEVMLMIPYGLHWSQVRRSNLIGVREDGSTAEGEGIAEISAATIHLGVHGANQNARCVMHTHAPYATSLGVLEDSEILMCHQNSTRFLDRVAYDRKYDGYSLEVNEGRRLAEIMGDKDILMMQNHGLLTASKSTAMAFDLMYYVEKSCMFQMIAAATGKALNIIPEHIVKQNAAFMKDGEAKYADNHFYAMMAKIIHESPDVDS